MPTFFILALYILQANGVIIPTPIWVLGWVAFGVLVMVAIGEAINKSGASDQRKAILALLTNINRKVK